MREIIFKNRKLQKFIAALLLVAILTPSFAFFAAPKKVEALGFPTWDAVGNFLQGVGNAFLGTDTAANVTSASISIWDRLQKILGQALRVVARRALAEMTKSTVNWINTGRFGRPFFIENPGSFFRDVTKTEIKSLIGITGYNTQLYPFAKSYWLGVIDRYRNQLAYNSQQSLYYATTDPDLYRRDFGTSGWEGLVNITFDSGNNALLYHISADEALATKLAQVNNKIDKTVNQGAGFLSLETCPSNPALDARNPLTVQPFDPSKAVTYDAKWVNDYTTALLTNDYSAIGGAKLALEAYNNSYNIAVDRARVDYNTANTCMGGWQTATPGRVAANEVMEAINIPQKNAWISAALGNSLTAIFDSLAQKFLGKGLRFLSKQINNTTPPDTFNYYGVTLDNTNTGGVGWNSGFDEVVDLDTFKKEISGKTQVVDSAGVIVQEDIGDTSGSPAGGTFIPGTLINTALELRMIDDTQPSTINPQLKTSLDRIRPVAGGQNPGLLQVIDYMWPVAFNLDQCIPGPNKGWQERLDKERDRVSSKLISETISKDQLKVRSANGAITDLKFAVQSFKDWVEIKMFSTIPNGALYTDSVKSMDDTAQELSQLTKKRLEKITAVARLQSIEAQLKAITVKPQPNTPQEKQLIKIWQQYTAASAQIVSQYSLEALQSELDLASEKLAELREYENGCRLERVAAQWELTGGIDSKNSSLAGGTYTEYKIGTPENDTYARSINPFLHTKTGSELEVFCSIPIISGYSHGEAIRSDQATRWVNRNPGYAPAEAPPTPIWFRFRNMPNNAGLPGYTDLPMTNAQNIYGDQTSDLDIIDVDLDCKFIFKSSINDYKHAGEHQF